MGHPCCLILCSWLSFSAHRIKNGKSPFPHLTGWLRKCFKGQNCRSFKGWFTEELELWFIIRALNLSLQSWEELGKSHPHLFSTSLHYKPGSHLSLGSVFAMFLMVLVWTNFKGKWEASFFPRISGQGFLLHLKTVKCSDFLCDFKKGQNLLSLLSFPLLFPLPPLHKQQILFLHSANLVTRSYSFTWTSVCSQDNWLCFCSWAAVLHNMANATSAQKRRKEIPIPWKHLSSLLASLPWKTESTQK